MKIRIVSLITFMMLFAGARFAAAQGIPMTFDVDGLQRNALVFAPAPSTTGSAKHPLIFAWHGHGGNNVMTAKMMHLQDLWPDAIVIYPMGLPTSTPHDPAGKLPGWQHTKGEQGDRDLKFFDAMLTNFKKSYAVDEKRIYTTGFSNGAIFSYVLWAERADTLAAIGINSGTIPDGVTLKTPRPAIIFAGETDQTLPFENQQASIAAAQKLDQATGTGQACGLRCMLYVSSLNTPVETRIFPRGHLVPPWAPQATVDFFKAHSL